MTSEIFVRPDLPKLSIEKTEYGYRTAEFKLDTFEQQLSRSSIMMFLDTLAQLFAAEVVKLEQSSRFTYEFHQRRAADDWGTWTRFIARRTQATSSPDSYSSACPPSAHPAKQPVPATVEILDPAVPVPPRTASSS